MSRGLGIYALKRLALVIPTLIAILAINVAVTHSAPGGPAETAIARAEQAAAAHGAPPPSAAEIAALRRHYGERGGIVPFLRRMGRYAVFDLGRSKLRDESVAALIAKRLPVSLALGLASTALLYLLGIGAGIVQAMRAGTALDAGLAVAMLTAAALPAFLLALLLIACLGIGGALPLFPLRGLASPGAAHWPLLARIADLLRHLILPVLAMTAGGIASLALLTRNAMLDEMGRLYVTALRARGASEAQILRRVARHAALLVVSTLPLTLVGILFGADLIVEIVFSIPGLGLLGFHAALARDYPVLFGTLYVYTLIALLAHLAGDLLYTALDPRLDFQNTDG